MALLLFLSHFALRSFSFPPRFETEFAQFFSASSATSPLSSYVVIVPLFQSLSGAIQYRPAYTYLSPRRHMMKQSVLRPPRERRVDIGRNATWLGYKQKNSFAYILWAQFTGSLPLAHAKNTSGWWRTFRCDAYTVGLLSTTCLQPLFSGMGTRLFAASE